MERVRAGELPRERVLLLAYVGHPGLTPQLVEEVAEWTAFNELDAALDVVLGEPVDALSLASWLLGLALFHPQFALRALALGFAPAADSVRELPGPAAHPNDPYPQEAAEEAELDREVALQLLNATLLAFMNWEATGGTPLLHGELTRAADHYRYSGLLPAGFNELFRLPALCTHWTTRDLEPGNERRRRRLELEGWTTLLDELGVDLAEFLHSVQRRIQGLVLAQL